MASEKVKDDAFKRNEEFLRRIGQGIGRDFEVRETKGGLGVRTEGEGVELGVWGIYIMVCRREEGKRRAIGVCWFVRESFLGFS